MISKDLDIAADFPPATYEEWRRNAEAELKGAPFEKKLVGRTFEGIDIQPLYTAEMWPAAGDPRDVITSKQATQWPSNAR